MKQSTYFRALRNLTNASSRVPALPVAGLVLGLAFYLSPVAQAQSATAKAPMVTPDKALQSTVTDAIFYAGPPEGFDPTIASPSELEQFGFPPRPDVSDAVPYAHWKKLVTSPQTRRTDLTVQATNIIHGNLKNGKMKGSENGRYTATSNNWSAYAVTDTKGTFAVNNSFVYSEWTIPAVGVENCSHTPYMSSQWVGFDGAFVSDDVLQAGTEVDGCPSHSYAWYEWYTYDCYVNSASQPCYSFSLNLPINAGDLMYGEVWYTTAAPHGHAYLYNYTTQQAASVAFNQPYTTYAPAYYQANSVEWVVERPNGGAPNLTNYVGDAFNFAIGYDGSAYFYPGSSPAGSNTYDITMTCPGWIPSSSCTTTTGISVPELSGLYTLWFYTEGPAYQ